jgi:hypothetical protein
MQYVNADLRDHGLTFVRGERLSEARAVAIDHHHMSAGIGESAGVGFADAIARAGNDGARPRSPESGNRNIFGSLPRVRLSG